jgi:hypothetical protein
VSALAPGSGADYITPGPHWADDRPTMSLVHASPDNQRTFSQVLEALGVAEGPTLTLGEVVEAFGDRGLGALILVLSLMALFPWPPGGKAVFAMPIILLAAELTFQRNEVWLPRWALRVSVSRSAYRTAVSRVIGPIRRVENLTRPRLTFLTGAVSEVLMGLTCVLLALVMALPVPLGDLLPALGLIFFALGVMQKDGVAVLLGILGTLATAAYLALIWRTAIEAAHHAASWLAHIAGWFAHIPGWFAGLLG